VERVTAIIVSLERSFCAFFLACRQQTLARTSPFRQVGWLEAPARGAGIDMHQYQRESMNVEFIKLPDGQLPKPRAPIMTTIHMSDIVRDQNPLILPPEMTVQQACQRMQKRRVGAVLVGKENGRLLGIFTGRDAVCRVVAKGKDASATTLADVMTQEPDTMPPVGTAIEALRLMKDGGFRHVPIVDDGRVVGIVSRGDFRATEQRRLDEETGLWERI
jgi:CBS domain-containing protein